ncbi:MAG: radical SAM protein [Thermoprotei archaeon]|nr:MAG: radical SAM protein [Thermoprotei archaeon]RLF22074.1 MAG: radical SAM protein [Thermoprotei archaeon]
MSEFVINVSDYISTMCYSVLRLEPYTSCENKCLYCYGRWYWTTNEVKPRFFILKLFRRIAEELSSKKLMMPFRLATLSEPLQDIEKKVKISYGLMEIAMKYKMPIILSTKSTLITKEPWHSLILRLSDENLILVQMTLVTLDTELFKKIEPRAPPPEERINALETLASEGVPIAVRLQPLIPGYSDEADVVESMIRQVSASGVRHVILEYLRATKDDLMRLSYIIKNMKMNVWTSYSIAEEGLLKPSLRYRINKLREVRSICEKYKVRLFTCKEGLFHLDSYGDCCGIYMMRNIMLRPTLREVWRVVMKRGRMSISEVVKELGGDYMFGEKLSPLPRIIRKPMRNHEKRLIKCISDGARLRRITPLLKVDKGYLMAQPVDPSSAISQG